jgi:GT2 family glycosyltransferase
LKKYKPKYILLLNKDTKIIQKDWLKKLVETAESDKKIGIVGPKLIYPDGRIQHAGIDIKSLKHRGIYEPKSIYTKTEEIDAVTGACLLISSRAISKIGCLDEVYSPFSFEDVDLCLRAKHGGFKIIFNGEVVLIHREGVSTRKKCR